MAGETTMSQEQIDALLGSNVTSVPASPPPPAPEPKVEPQVPAAPVAAPAEEVPTAPAVGRVPTFQELEEAVDRIAVLENALRSVGELDRSVYDVESNMRQVQQDIRTMFEQFQKLAAQFSAVVSNLKATPGYAALKTFRCGSCGKAGHVAVPVRCTHCGKQTYKGRFPNKK